MKIYHAVSVYKDALVDGTNNSDQHKFAVGEGDEQKFNSMGSPKLERIKKHGSECQADAKAIGDVVGFVDRDPRPLIPTTTTIAPSKP